MNHVAVERSLILLKYTADSPEGLSIREASRELGYSPSIVQKLVNALKAQGYVVQDKATGRYRLGPAAVQLGLIALSRLDLRRLSRPHMEKLNKETGETVLLGIARDRHAVYIDKVLGSQPIRMDVPLGVDRPYNCTAVGKVLLAGMPDENIEKLASEGAFERRTEKSIYDVDAVKAEIEKVREQGWALDRGEYVPGVECVAAPILNHDREVIAAVTVSGPSAHIEKRLDYIVEKVKACARAISREMGARV